MTRCTTLLLTGAALLAASAGNGAAILIDLNTLYADPTVLVSADGSQASVAEDAFLSPVLLTSFDPVALSPDVLFEVRPNERLHFDLDFVEPPGNDDVFFVEIFDASFFPLDIVSIRPIACSAFSFDNSCDVDSVFSGTLEFDLSAFAGDAIGLQFGLGFAGSDGGLDSIATIRNVVFDDLSVAVNEPGPITLWLGALLSLMLVRRRL